MSGSSLVPVPLILPSEWRARRTMLILMNGYDPASCARPGKIRIYRVDELSNPNALPTTDVGGREIVTMLNSTVPIMIGPDVAGINVYATDTDASKGSISLLAMVTADRVIL